ncbi:hypothetical protein GCM10023175_33750 [Pseudonocardia xishanensis]|uniref:ArsR family transcriptional regulator n=1 Tax=Pseudonocardia xishanensis TaxID=630995 RepID=A0ABP8RT78_9PSEU
MVVVEAHGRHRFHRLAGPHVGRLLEAMVALAPPRPVTSLRDGTRARALRRARTCYDHLAGELGVGIMRHLLAAGLLTGGDGRRDPADPPVGFGQDVDYRFTPAGDAWLDEFGVRLTPGRRAVRYCVDWTEQAHHLSGSAGAGILTRLVELGWIRRAPNDRAVILADPAALDRTFGAPARSEGHRILPQGRVRVAGAAAALQLGDQPVADLDHRVP